MTKEEMYYQAGRDRDASHDTRNRDLQAKTLGALTFGVSIFALAVSLIKSDIDFLTWLSVAIMAIVLSVMIYFGIRILYLSEWKYPFKLHEIQDALDEYKKSKMVKLMADQYVVITTKNAKVLQKKEGFFDILMICAFVECGTFILFKIFSLCPFLP